MQIRREAKNQLLLLRQQGTREGQPGAATGTDIDGDNKEQERVSQEQLLGQTLMTEIFKPSHIRRGHLIQPNIVVVNDDI